ncbi:MAG TPA: phosphatase, partial [Casimicrobiaceae bacterium]|nr:phosphatase [Casimicrobiaceae bacterium]
QEFRDLGGAGLEIVSPSHTSAQYDAFARLGRVFGLKGSCGSDFHGPGESRFDFGDVAALPPGVDPIWSGW